MNQRMTLDEYNKLIIENFDPRMAVNFMDARETFVTYYGICPIVFAQYSREVIIFAECDYCRNGNSLDKYDCCVHCGGPVE